jgi:hypothetical protein
LGVNTPAGFAGSMLQLKLPKGLEFDKTANGTSRFKCEGTGNLAVRITCNSRNFKVITIILQSNDRKVRMLKSGTTISFDLGYLINPPSFRESESFEIKTFL